MAARDHPARLLSGMADLEVEARDAAFSLFTINQLAFTQEETVNGIVHNLFAIVGVIPALRNLLLATPDSPLLSHKQVEALSRHLASCHSVLVRIEAAVREADGSVDPFSPKNRAGELSHIQTTVTTCFRDLVVVVISATRANHLSRFGYLTDEALKHPAYNNPPELADSPQAPASAPALMDRFSAAPGPQPSDTPSSSNQPREVLELQHPCGFRGRYGHPDYPFPHKQVYVQLSPPDPALHFDKSFEEAELQRYRLRYVAELPHPPHRTQPTSARAKGRYPDIGAFGNWPPTSIEPNSVQGCQTPPIMSKNMPNGIAKDFAQQTAFSATSSPANTPVSTRESTPAAKGTVVGDAVDTQPNIKSQSHGRSLEAKPDAKVAAAHTTTDKSSTSEFTSGIHPTLHNRPTPPPSFAINMEAYILRALCKDVHVTIEWSYKVEKLSLGNAEIQAHMRKLGPEYSVIDSIADLLPEQLRLIEIQVQARQGHLISIRHGRAADLVTKMGTFQVQPVIFILTTSCSSETEDEITSRPKAFDSARNAVAPQGGLSGNNGGFGSGTGFSDANPQRASFGGFGGGLGAQSTSMLGGGRLFGSTPAASGYKGLVEQSATQPRELFGGTQPGGPFGGAPPGGPFGGAQPSEPFGGTQPGELFGGTRSGSQTGQTHGGAFGGFGPFAAQPNKSPFTGGFTSASQSPTASPFSGLGQQTNTRPAISSFGQPGSPLFNNDTQTRTPFANTSTQAATNNLQEPQQPSASSAAGQDNKASRDGSEGGVPLANPVHLPRPDEEDAEE